MDEHLERIANLEIGDAHTRRQFAPGHDAFGFAADVDEQLVMRLRDDDAREHLTFVEGSQTRFVELLFERELVLCLRFRVRRYISH
jgi:hypothetical protein